MESWWRRWRTKAASVDQGQLVRPTPLLEPVLRLRGLAAVGKGPADEQPHRAAGAGVAGTGGGVVVLMEPAVQVGGDARVERVVGAAEEVEVVGHGVGLFRGRLRDDVAFAVGPGLGELLAGGAICPVCSE